VLRGVSLDVQPGEFLSLVGQSGSGKSTLLNIIGGLDLPDDGEVEVLGYDYNKASEKQKARLRNGPIGFVFQSFNLLDHLTCLGNVTLSAQFAAGATRIYVSMMLLAVTSMAVPSTFRTFSKGVVAAEHQLNLAVAVVLVALYVLYLFFMLKTHPHLFAAEGGGEGHAEGGERWSVARAVLTLLAASVLAAWMSEVLVGAAEGTGQALGMSQAFVGLVFLAIVGGAAESGSAIAMARANRMDLSVSIAIGSCIQIALFVAPVLVFLSYVMAPQPLQLLFPRVLVGTSLVAVLVGAVVAGDGHSNWFKGVQLVAVYALFALLAYFVPA
jgi:Ca2+:H+ antiporter